MEKKGSVIGVDINEGFLERFKERMSLVSNQKIDVKTVQVDILDENELETVRPLEDSADLVMCTISCHHFYNYGTIIEKLASFLKPGGKLYIIDFHTEAPAPQQTDTLHGVYHAGGLSKEGLRSAMAEAGLEVVSSEREMSVRAWQPKDFITHHLDKEVVAKMQHGELESRETNGEIMCVVETAILLGVAKK